MSAKQHEEDQAEAQALPSLPGAVTVADMYLERMTRRMEEMSNRLAHVTSFLEKVGLHLENQANAPVATLAPETVSLEWGEVDPITERLDKITERLDKLIAILERAHGTVDNSPIITRIAPGETKLREGPAEPQTPEVIDPALAGSSKSKGTAKRTKRS